MILNERLKKFQEPAWILLIVFAGLFFRRPDAFTNPQLWAEDGTVFLQQYLQKGAASLFTPYAGYIHLIPRLIAFIFGSIHVSLYSIPLLYNLSAFIITYSVALHLWRCALKLQNSNPVFFATVFLFLPIGAEMFMNITNIIWITALCLIAYLLTGHGKSSNTLFKSILLILCALTGPFSLLLTPLILLIILKERKTISQIRLINLLLIAACGLIQLGFIKSSGKISRGIPGVPEKMHLLKLGINNISEQLFLPSGHYILPIVAALAFFVLLFFAYRKITLPAKYVLLLSPILFLGAFIVAFWPNEAHVTAFVCSRYYFVPFTCLSWVFILSIHKAIPPRYLAAFFAFYVLHLNQERSTLPDKNWANEVNEYKLGKKNSLNINPEGWKVEMRAQ